MELTGLEALLLGASVAAVSSIGTALFVGGKYRTTRLCDERCAEFEKRFAKRDSDSQLVLRMLRAVIMYLPIDDAKKERILNDSGEE